MNIQFQRYPVLIAVVWAVFFNSQATANTYEVTKFKAFLPMSYNVPPHRSDAPGRRLHDRRHGQAHSN
jgi:hypothetical protein